MYIEKLRIKFLVFIKLHVTTDWPIRDLYYLSKSDKNVGCLFKNRYSPISENK